MQEKKNIVLIGFMATGKSSVAHLLAKRLNKRVVSTDSLIEKKSKKTIPQIFKQDGEIRFRELEIQVVKKVSEMKNIIVDCGGGVVLNKINIDRLKKNGIIILLTARPEEILKRENKEKGARPLLSKKEKLKVIKELLNFRKPFYEGSCDYKINTSKLSIEEVGEKIIKIYNAKENKKF